MSLKFREIDWRQSSVRQILSALSQGLDAVYQRFLNGGDVDDANEYENDLCGIAFVAAQAYITGVVADVRALRGPNLTKPELLESDNPVVAGTKLTQMQLCDTMANYYKHRDEWSDWDDVEKPAARRTIQFLRTAGFAQRDQYLCSTVARLMLLNDEEIKSLVPLMDMLTSWREKVIVAR